MKTLFEIFEKKKNEYKFAFYDTKKDEIVLVKGRYRLLNNNKFYVDYADKNLFGKDILASRTKDWRYIGRV